MAKWLTFEFTTNVRTLRFPAPNPEDACATVDTMLYPSEIIKTMKVERSQEETSNG